MSVNQQEMQREEAALWLQYAENDFRLVQHLFYGDYYPKPLEIICYHCQQTAEKAVKALVVSLGSRGGIPKTHDIQFLLTQIRRILKSEKGIEISEEIYDCAAALTKYSIAVRYPNELYVDEAGAQKAVEDAKTLFDWVTAILRSEE